MNGFKIEQVKIKSCLNVRLLVLFFLFGTYSLSAQHLSFHKKAQMLIGDFSAHHLRPIETNESTAREIFDLFIRELDPDGMVLKETDIAALKIGLCSFNDIDLVREHSTGRRAS